MAGGDHFAMKISHKLLLVIALPAILIWVVGFYAQVVGERSLRKSIERSSVARASAVMDEIDRVMHIHIAEWMAYVRSPLVQRTLAASNKQFRRMSDRQRYIDDQDRAWRKAEAGSLIPMMKRLIGNELAQDMQVRLTKLEQENGYAVYGEAFITNRYGAKAAQTNRTSDYRQDDEDWWRLARRDGRYVGDVGFDESANAYSTDICVRIDDEQG